jgi:hypothetical protein
MFSQANQRENESTFCYGLPPLEAYFGSSTSVMAFHFPGLPFRLFLFLIGCSVIATEQLFHGTFCLAKSGDLSIAPKEIDWRIRKVYHRFLCIPPYF